MTNERFERPQSGNREHRGGRPTMYLPPSRPCRPTDRAKSALRRDAEPPARAAGLVATDPKVRRRSRQNKEAIRALKRQISNNVYRHLVADTRH